MSEIALATPGATPGAAPVAATTAATAVATADGAFAPSSALPGAVARLARAYVGAFYAAYPHRGIWAGWPGSAGRAPDLSVGAFQQRIATLTRWEGALDIWRASLASAQAYASLPVRWRGATTTQSLSLALPPDTQIRNTQRAALAADLTRASLEIEALHDACVKERFNLRDWTYYGDNPASYFPALDISPYLMRAFAPRPDRLHALTTYLRHIPHLIAQIEERLGDTTPHTAAPGAHWVYRRLLAFYQEQAPALGLALLQPDRAEDGAPPRAPVAPPPATDERNYLAALEVATAALARFVTWLTSRDEPRGRSAPALGASGAMGEATLATMLRVCLRETASLDELVALGEADLAQNQQRAAELAGRMGLGAAPLSDAFAALDNWPPQARWSARNATAISQNALAHAAATIDELRMFTLEHDLLDPAMVDGECRVAFQPPYLASPFAMLEAPGAFERAELPAWLYLPRAPQGTLTHTATGQPIARSVASDWRRGWRSRMTPCALRVTVTHESIPGHFAFQRALRAIPSLAARTFRNYATFEGWAHYAEELVIEQGFGADDPRNALAMRRAAIQRDCRYLVSLRLHTGDLSLDAAATLIADQTGLARTLAESEARRCLADPACVGYTLGKLRLLQLRDDYARQHGADFTLRGFHDAVLALGQLPLTLIRSALLVE